MGDIEKKKNNSTLQITRVNENHFYYLNINQFR